MKYKSLPHKDVAGHYQFITFRTHDSLDDFIKKQALEKTSNSKKQLAIDAHLDLSAKGSYLNGEILTNLYRYFYQKDQVLFELVSFCIMPNHVHLLIKPLKPLPEVIKLLKGSSAKMSNDLMQKQGRFWAQDYYDRGIRDQEHFDVVYRYIQNNPLKLNEADRQGRFYGIYDV